MKRFLKAIYEKAQQISKYRKRLDTETEWATLFEDLGGSLIMIWNS